VAAGTGLRKVGGVRSGRTAMVVALQERGQTAKHRERPPECDYSGPVRSAASPVAVSYPPRGWSGPRRAASCQRPRQRAAPAPQPAAV